MKQDQGLKQQSTEEQLIRAYETEKPKLMARIRAASRSLEDAEDLVQDVYAETWGRLSRLANIVNLPAWLNSLVTRRLIDAWRHDQVRKSVGETQVAEETLREVIASTGLDPLDSYVRDSMVDAMNSAIKTLPEEQRKVLEAQVFGGMTFAELADKTGESIDTLKARKRYGIKNLSRVLKDWINE